MIFISYQKYKENVNPSLKNNNLNLFSLHLNFSRVQFKSFFKILLKQLRTSCLQVFFFLVMNYDSNIRYFFLPIPKKICLVHQTKCLFTSLFYYFFYLNYYKTKYWVLNYPLICEIIFI